ncbi:MAG TPA: GNAT family protein [Thermoplasmata archaeon]|nr:GNAT family protein [Thermoplasmata archaeon]
MTAPEVPTLEGRLVVLRPPEEPDLPWIFDWYNDPETVAPFDRFSLDTFPSFRHAVETAPGDPRSTAPRFVFERLADRELLGVVGYYEPHPILETVEVWYVLGEPSQRGKGFGRDAVGLLVDHLFRDREYERVGATSDVDNRASVRLLEGLGFHREGTLRSALRHHGRWHDAAIYGVTRSDWTEASKSRSTIRSPGAGG